jgi:type II secretory pathway component GspD/PulD (secretin)
MSSPRLILRFPLSALLATGLAIMPARPAISQTAGPPTLPVEPGDTMNLNFPEGVTLNIFLRAAELYTKKRFLFQDASLHNRQIFIYAEHSEIPTSHFFPLFEAILAMNGFTLVPLPAPDGAEEPLAYRVVQLSNAQSLAGEPSLTAEEVRKLPFVNRWVSGVFPLQHVTATEISPTLVNFVSNPKGIIVLQSANAILVSDLGLNVKRIERVIQLMDVPNRSPDVRIIRLKQASAAALQPALWRVAGTLSGVRDVSPSTLWRGGVVVVDDPHTNSIVIVGNPSHVADMVKIVETLDVASTTPPSSSASPPASSSNEKKHDRRQRRIAIAVIGMLHVGLGVWLYRLSRQEKGQPWIWLALGLALGLIAVLIFFLHSIRNSLRSRP